jgi:hypothetical protein
MIPVVLAAVLVSAHVAAASSGTSTLTLLYSWAGILGGLAVLGALFTKYIWPSARSLKNFFSDWEGRPARPGVPEQPGVMERLSNQDVRLETLEFDVKTIKHEVHLNSGQSIKDIAQRTEQKVDSLHARVDAIDQLREGERVQRSD